MIRFHVPVFVLWATVSVACGNAASGVCSEGCVERDAAGIGGEGNEWLVSGAWLEERLGEPGLQVIDVRTGESYAEGHVPGALHVPIERALATIEGVHGQVASASTVSDALGGAGVRRDATVITYGDSRGLSAARLLWTLEHYGHADVRRLDGGWTAWRADGRSIETGPAESTPGDYPIDTAVEGLRVDAEWLLDHLDDPDVHIVDVRTRGEYEEGHVPGAVHIEWTHAVGEDDLMRRAAELGATFGAIPYDGTVVTYCTTGVRASMGYFTFRWLGYPDVRVYDGSWSEWGSRPDLPKEGAPERPGG